MQRQCLLIIAFDILVIFVTRCWLAPIQAEEGALYVIDEDEPEPCTSDYEESDFKRNAVTQNSKKWPNGIIPYKISNAYSSQQVERIEIAMRQIEEDLGGDCITFVEADENDVAFVNIDSVNTGCGTQLGYSGSQQNLNLHADPLDTKCFRNGTIQHELMHCVGQRHQHVATLRDNYVTVNWDNIQTGKESNFQINPSIPTNDYGCGYDYGSIMHYGPYGFAIDPSIPTLIPDDPNAVIGQRNGLSATDICKGKAMYNCTNN